MADKSIALMAHLMRRAGFAAPREELEARVAKGYEATVEELLDPEAHGISPIDEYIMYRHCPEWEMPSSLPTGGQANWMYRMINTPRPLEEKIALFWHHVFATSYSKLDSANEVLSQLDMFRRYGMGNYRDLLVQVAKDPAMIYWLDNNLNHKDAPNENWGRELLELFSMGQGNYTEKDVLECSRAFTGWTITPKIPRIPYNRFLWGFEYRSEDHDDGEKVFLGHRGNFNGEDIIDIIVRQPATPRFVARHLYNFFVADEVQVPSWLDTPPRDPVAINIIGEAFISSGYDIRSTLRVLFNSDFFKDESVRYAKVKSPAEVVAGTLRLVGDYQSPKPSMMDIGREPGYQGQGLLDPPSVEGWHTGQEWINSGSLLRRVNFVAGQVGNTHLPGVQSIIERVGTKDVLSSDEFVDNCLEMMGPVMVNEETHRELMEHVETAGPILRGNTEEEHIVFANRVGELLQLIGATREYQFG